MLVDFNIGGVRTRQPRAALVIAAVGMLIGIASAVILSLNLRTTEASAIGVGGLVYVPLAVYAWVEFRANRRRRRELAQVAAAPAADVGPIVRQWLSSTPSGTRDMLTWSLQRVLARRTGDAGRVYRLYRTPPKLIEPAAAAFEPVRLCDVDDHWLTDAEDAAKPSRPVRTARRAGRAAVFVGLAAAWTIQLAGSVFAIALRLVGRVDQGFAWAASMSVVLAACVVFTGFALYLQHRGTLLLVPGAVVLRRSSLLGRPPTLLLFEARRSVLILSERGFGGWYLTLVTPERRIQRGLALRESCAILRAWLSPIQPPSIEQLRTLA